MNRATEIDVTFYVNGTAAPLSVTALRGREAISELFSFEIELLASDLSFDVDALVGEPAHVVVSWDGVVRHFDGLVSDFEELDTSSEGTTYRVKLVPSVALLDYGASCRVFSELTLPELISQVLKEHGIEDVRLSLSDAYAKRALFVQYRETEWAMLSRWMEAEGIRYFFEHREGGHTLVITDAATTHEDITGEKTIHYREETLDAGENVLSFELSRRIVPARVSVRDYPLENPAATKEDTAEAKEGGKVSFSEFPATNAKKRLEALRAGEKKGRGKASTLRMVPDRVFDLEGHPRSSYNDGWLLVAVEHQCRLAKGEPSTYETSFECVPAKTPYRPERKTPWPRILGAQMVTITSEHNAELQTDESGRALAVFHWDSTKTSVWVPMAQVAASRGFGTVSLPRAGDTALVEFLDGDPDRPILTGRLYNKVNVHPYTLPSNATKTVFRDASTPGGNGYNELTFDSASGAEEVYLRAERNSRVEVKNDATRKVGNDDSLTVTGDQSTSVQGSSTHSIVGISARTVGLNETVSIVGSQVVSVGSSQTITISGDRSLAVGGSLESAIDGDRSASVEGDDSLEITGGRKVEIGGNRVTSIEGSEILSVSGSRVESVEGNVQRVVDGYTYESHGSLYVSVTGDTSFSYSGDVTTESSTVQKIGAPKVYIAAGTNLYLRALESITLEVGDSKLTIENGKITVTDGSANKTLTGDTIYLNC